jgi:hypothetical protein
MERIRIRSQWLAGSQSLHPQEAGFPTGHVPLETPQIDRRIRGLPGDCADDGWLLLPAPNWRWLGFGRFPESRAAAGCRNGVENEVYTDAGRTIRFASASMDYIFKIALRCGKSPVRYPQFVPSRPRHGEHVIPARQFRLYGDFACGDGLPAWYLRLTPELRARREYGGPLVHLAAPWGIAIEVRPGRTEAVWVAGGRSTRYAARDVRRMMVGRTGSRIREVGCRSRCGLCAPQTRHLAVVAD